MDFFDNQGHTEQENGDQKDDNNNFAPFNDFNDNPNPQPTGFIPLGGGNEGNSMGFDMSNQFDEEEEARIAERREEEAQRRKKIEEKQSLELKLKEEYRGKAADFLQDFESKRINAIQMRKKQNVQKEQDALTDKQMVIEGKKNPWEKVLDNIAIKESDYKGTKNVSRMRAVILSRKGDYSQLSASNKLK